MGELLADIQAKIDQLAQDIQQMKECTTIAAWGLNLATPTPGVEVPTASPYQLTHELLFALQGLGPVATDPPPTEETMLRGLVNRANLDLPALHKGRTKPTTAGRPAMVYVTLLNGKIIFGASGLLWEKYVSAKSITTRARETRLRTIIGPASTAMQVLQAKEMAEQAESPAERRRLAIEKMAPDPSFLGGHGAKGLAYKPLWWEPRQPCYFCQGVYGCIFVLEWTAEDKAKNLMDWR